MASSASTPTTDDRADELAVDTDDDALVSILTNGDPIRAFATLVSPIADEARLRIDSDGLHVTAVDPANVAMVDLDAHAEGFERFEIDHDRTVGLDVDRFASVVGWARRRTGDGDPVAIDIFDRRLRVRITRPDQQMTRVTEWFTIDPDSLRKEPDIPNFDRHTEYARLDADTLDEATSVIDGSYPRAYLSRTKTHPETLAVSTHEHGEMKPEGDDLSDAVKLPNCAWTDSDEDATPSSALFSLDYLDEMTSALKSGKADRATLSWGEEWPVDIQFQHEDWGFDGRYVLAPRIQKDDG